MQRCSVQLTLQLDTQRVDYRFEDGDERRTAGGFTQDLRSEQGLRRLQMRGHPRVR